ncbi:hypothetical protein L0430_003113, partial [Salmonella enterica]|nr:hypothetical protein [Salmonella enterica]
AQLMKMKIPESEIKKYIIEAKEVFELLREKNKHLSFDSNNAASLNDINIAMPGSIDFI